MYQEPSCVSAAVAVVALAVVGLLAPSLALGAQAHFYERSIGEGPGPGAGELSLAAPGPFALNVPGSGLAVDDASEALYVADTGNHRVDEFEAATGAFVRAWGWGVENGESKLQVCTTMSGCRQGLSGSSPGEFGALAFIAVDNSSGASHGDVYVATGVGREAADAEQLVTLVGASGGTFTLSFEGQPTTPLAYDASAGEVEGALEAVSTIGRGNVRVREPAPGSFSVAFQGALKEKRVPQLTADASDLTPVGSKVEVSTTTEGTPLIVEVISKFGPDGEPIESWGEEGRLNGSGASEGPFPPTAGIAVDGSGDLWVYSSQHRVYEFNENAEPIKATCYTLGGAATRAGLAVTEAGDLYLQTASGVSKTGPDCEEMGKVTVVDGEAESATSLAVDTVTGDLFYVFELGTLVGDISSQCSVGCLPAQEFGPPELSEAAGVAVDSVTGTVFAANTAADRVDVFPVGLEAVVRPARGVGGTTVTLNGEVNPKGAQITDCTFQYGETEAYGKVAPCETEPGKPLDAGDTPVKVHANLEGLKGATTYHFRVHAANKGRAAIDSEHEAFTTKPTAVIEETSGSEVEGSSGSAEQLTAKVNPEGLAVTSCLVEYGTTTAYGNSLACEPGDGTGGVTISDRLERLVAGTTYHWRVVVTDADGTVTGVDNTFVDLPRVPVVLSECPNETVRGESDVDPSTGMAFSDELPDCRAYEMVTPPAKNGALVDHGFFIGDPAIFENGSRVISPSIQCFSGSLSCDGDRQSEGEPFEFERTPSGWVTHAMAPLASHGSTVYGYSSETGMVLYSLPPAEGGLEEFYAREPDGTLQAIGPIAEQANFKALNGETLVATGNLSHMVYTARSPVWGFDKGDAEAETLYEYVGFGNLQPVLVGVSGGEGSTARISACGTFIGGAKKAVANQYNSLSGDGRTVYFTAQGRDGGTGSCPARADAPPVDELYVRVDQSHTVAISAPAPKGEPCGEQCRKQPPGDAEFQGASVDGSRVFFTTTQQLTDGASEDAHGGESAVHPGCVATPAGRSGCNLYESECPNHCENETQRSLTDLSAGDISGLGPEVQGVMAISPDGSHVYFVAKGVLAGENAEHHTPSEGSDNLYVYERDGEHPQGRVVFIATLPGDGDETLFEWEEGMETANVTPEGRFLVFESHGALTPDATGGGGEQVYRYDAQDEQLLRVSIGQHGWDDDGNTGSGNARIVDSAEGFANGLGPVRADPSMSNDGSFVFFESPVGLTPGALNDVPVNGDGSYLAENIYEWEAPGTEVDGKLACGEPSGCVYLISDGHDTTEGGSVKGLPTGSSVELIGADGSGENVFFTTADRLVGQDTDTESDYYDARVNGGYPRPAPETPCQVENNGEECRVSGPEPGIFDPMGTATFPGEATLTVETKPTEKPKPTPLTRAEKLAKALKSCRKDVRKKKRATCERQARMRYGPIKKKKKAR
jgi:DNA-binding beta-propeller fold protein YncE